MVDNDDVGSDVELENDDEGILGENVETDDNIDFDQICKNITTVNAIKIYTKYVKIRKSQIKKNKN